MKQARVGELHRINAPLGSVLWQEISFTINQSILGQLSLKLYEEVRGIQSNYQELYVSIYSVVLESLGQTDISYKLD